MPILNVQGTNLIPIDSEAAVRCGQEIDQCLHMPLDGLSLLTAAGLFSYPVVAVVHQLQNEEALVYTVW